MTYEVFNFIMHLTFLNWFSFNEFYQYISFQSIVNEFNAAGEY